MTRAEGCFSCRQWLSEEQQTTREGAAGASGKPQPKSSWFSVRDGLSLWGVVIDGPLAFLELGQCTMKCAGGRSREDIWFLDMIFLGRSVSLPWDWTLQYGALGKSQHEVGTGEEVIFLGWQR